MDFLTDNSIMHGGSEWADTAKLRLVFAIIFAIISAVILYIYDTQYSLRMSDIDKIVRDENKKKSDWFRFGPYISVGVIFIIIMILGNSRITYAVVASIMGAQVGLCLSLINPDDLKNAKALYDNKTR